MPEPRPENPRDRIVPGAWDGTHAPERAPEGTTAEQRLGRALAGVCPGCGGTPAPTGSGAYPYCEPCEDRLGEPEAAGAVDVAPWIEARRQATIRAFDGVRARMRAGDAVAWDGYGPDPEPPGWREFALGFACGREAEHARAERLAALLTPGYEHRQQAEAMERDLLCTCGVPFAGDCPRHNADYVEGWIGGWDAARAALAGDAPGRGEAG